MAATIENMDMYHWRRRGFKEIVLIVQRYTDASNYRRLLSHRENLALINCVAHREPKMSLRDGDWLR